jgi:hypothetical protein
MTGEQLINEDLGRGGFDVIAGIYRHLLGCIVEYHEHLRYYIHCTGPVSNQLYSGYRGTDKSLARPGRKQVTATENIDVPISYL